MTYKKDSAAFLLNGMLAHSTNSTGLYLEVPILLLYYTVPSFSYTATKKIQKFYNKSCNISPISPGLNLKGVFPETLPENIFR